MMTIRRSSNVSMLPGMVYVDQLIVWVWVIVGFRFTYRFLPLTFLSLGSALLPSMSPCKTHLVCFYFNYHESIYSRPTWIKVKFEHLSKYLLDGFLVRTKQVLSTTKHHLSEEPTAGVCWCWCLYSMLSHGLACCHLGSYHLWIISKCCSSSTVPYYSTTQCLQVWYKLLIWIMGVLFIGRLQSCIPVLSILVDCEV